jgi:PhoPQ-activated pathogenicity-related protein
VGALWLLGGLRLAAADREGPLAPAALDEYVQRPDPAYAWKVEKSLDGTPLKTVVIRLTSQRWRTEKEVDRPLWEHWLIVVRPETLKSNTALLLVSGGGNDRGAPEAASAIAAQIAAATGSIVAEIKQVPNQPLIFNGDGRPRKEDDLIGYCWDQYLQTGDATWLPRLPMTKSVVRALDCLQEWSGQEGNRIEKFVVAGASKRGWTTWMAGAADRRVLAIIPIYSRRVRLDLCCPFVTRQLGNTIPVLS